MTLIKVAASVLNVSTAQPNHNAHHTKHQQQQHATHKHFTHIPHITSEPVLVHTGTF